MKENEVKLFQNSSIRSVWDNINEQWYFSVVDIVAALTEQANFQTARNYWNKLKERLRKEGNESVTNCHQLKLRAQDGKKRLTDVATTEEILRIIQSIPSKKAEPFKVWLAQVGRERIDEINDPEIAIQRAMDTYLSKGYDPEWIIQRLQSIKIRRKLTDEWDKHGIRKGVEYAVLTDAISKGWSDLTTREYKDLKGLKKESLRDNMTDLELVFNMLAEATATDMTKTRNPDGFQENMQIAKDSGIATKSARIALEKQLGHFVVSPENNFSNNIDNFETKKLSAQKSEVVEQKYLEKYGKDSDEVLILAHIAHFGSITVKSGLDNLSGISKRTLQRRLHSLVEDGVLKQMGKTNRTIYYSNEKS